ncbi:MAG: FAD:protein FMN transferase [Candidatus Sulfotelmatobacter sp.]
MRSNKWYAAALLVFFFSLASSSQSSENKVLVYKKKYVMGTVFEIAAYDARSEHAAASIDKAFQEVVRIDDLLSNYKPESALSHLNRSAHFHAETVSPDLYRFVEQALQFSKLSGGKFDLTVAPLVNLWKAALSGGAMPSSAQQDQARACVGYEKIELTPPDQITFHSSCLQLDPGAIGKGYAVDRAAEVLRSQGVRDAFINAGGSTMLAMGTPPGQTAWRIQLRDPSNKIAPYVLLKDQSISTSEQTPRSLLGPDSAGHIIDPDTGRPLETQFAVSVIASTGTLTDGLSTTLLLLGPAQGKSLVAHMPDVSAIWISPKPQIETAINGPQILLGGKL